MAYEGMTRFALVLVTACVAALDLSASEFLVYEGTEGPGVGKHIVFIANDHEYRSEETCPALARILARHHGYKCTVLFGINEEGFIQAGSAPVPGLEVLKGADLLVFYARFMNLPDEQVDLLVDYFERGGPVVGLRTSTHPFNGQQGKWAKLNYTYDGQDYRGGLGEQIFGNTWHKERGQTHYGGNHTNGGRISAVPGAETHPILTGVEAFHGYSGAYSSQPPADATPLLQVQVLDTFGPEGENHPDKPIVNAGWSRSHYTAPSGAKKEARVVYTSYGASEDLLDEGGRRFLVNACLWALGQEETITADLDVSLVGGFRPSPYTTGAFSRERVKPSDLAGWESTIMPNTAKMSGLDDVPENRISRVKRVLEVRPDLVEWLQEHQPGFDSSRFQLDAE